MRTFSPKASDRKANWYVIDATDVVLGRLASQAATLLRGKHKVTFAPHVDMGDFVVIINADKVSLSGSKLTQKFAHRHSGFPGGITSIVYGDLVKENPSAMVEKAVLGMLPKNKLGRSIGTKLKVYAGAEHPHAAQNPIAFQINQVSQIVK